MADVTDAGTEGPVNRRTTGSRTSRRTVAATTSTAPRHSCWEIGCLFRFCWHPLPFKVWRTGTASWLRRAQLQQPTQF